MCRPTSYLSLGAVFEVVLGLPRYGDPMKYSTLFNTYHKMIESINLPIGIPVNLGEFNQLQNELDAIASMISNITASIDNGIPLNRDYQLRAHGVALSKAEDGLWEINPTKIIPAFPAVFTKQQARRINKCICVIKANANALITSPNIIDYVGKESQLDWASIGFLLQYGIDLIECMENYYYAGKH